MQLKNKDMIVIAVVTDIALGGRSRVINGRQLAHRHDLPPRYLEPVLQALVHAGILSGVRGPRGGYKLAREPAQITVEDILRAMGGLEDSEDFAHSPLLNAVVRPAIERAEKTFLDRVSGTSIDDLIRIATGSN
jgi:Rrf2 family protein